MTDTYTPNLKLVLQQTGTNSGTWGDDLNDGMISLVDSSIAGVLTISTTGGITNLTTPSGSSAGSTDSRNAVLNVTGALTSDATVTSPVGESKIYLVANNTSGSYTLSVSCATSLGVPTGTAIEVPQGQILLCYTEGTNFYLVGASTLQGTATGTINMNNNIFSNANMKSYYETVVPLNTISGAQNLDYSQGNYQTMTFDGNVTFTLTNWPVTGKGASMTLFITQDGTGGRTLSFSGSSVMVPGGGGLVLSSAGNATDEVLITSFNGGTTLYAAVLKNFGS